MSMSWTCDICGAESNEIYSTCKVGGMTMTLCRFCMLVSVKSPGSSTPLTPMIKYKEKTYFDDILKEYKAKEGKKEKAKIARKKKLAEKKAKQLEDKMADEIAEKLVNGEET